MSEGEIVGALDRPMREEFSRLEAHLTEFLHDQQLSLPEKEGVLALILGEDNSLLRGVQYEQENLVLDDGISVPVDLYVDTFNTLARTTGTLPLRGEFPGLKRHGILDSLENDEAFNPLGSLKQLKKEIQNTTAFIRRKSAELDDIKLLGQERRKVREVRGGAGEEAEHRVAAAVKEQPLDNVYTPAQGITPANSVDLREFFSPAREQGDLGACTTFAAVAMYEAEINRRAPKGNKAADLSEQFVYHFTNVVTGRGEGGSNFYEQFAVMGRMGVCEEELFAYDPSNLGKEPSGQAVENALSHRVVKARQIPLASTGSKIDCIDRNHQLLTSALSEGYPVGISLIIYGSFAERAPFVGRPDDSDLESGEAGAHAMVIVGYSESDRCYIVRNSWGEDFGDNGYCYISSSYVDDPDYNMFACIISETTESGGDRQDGPVPQLVAPFAGDESEIKGAVIRNVLDKERVRLASLEAQYRELYRYYQQLLQQLGNHSVRNDLRMRAEDQSSIELAQLSNKELELQDSFVGTLKAFKRSYIKGALALTGGTLFYDLVYLLLLFKTSWEPGFWSTLVGTVFTVITVFVWLGYKWECRRKRRELNARLADLAVERSNAERDFMEKQLRYHVAGMWIDSFHELQVRLQRTYNRMMAFNAGLRRWSAEDREALDRPERESGQTIIYLDEPERLKAMFEANEERIAGGINLMDCFDRYLSSGVELDLLRENLDSEVGQKVDSLFDDFSMSDYLTGVRRYPYLAPADLASIITRMVGVGQPSLRHKTSEALPPAIYLLLQLNDRQLAGWRRACDPLFPFPPAVVRGDNGWELDMVMVQAVPVSALR